MNDEALDGWCRVGSKVMSDFYIEESGKLRTVTKITDYKQGDGRVWTDGIRPLDGVDFKLWIKPYRREDSNETK